jgi:hypothetical protein
MEDLPTSSSPIPIWRGGLKDEKGAENKVEEGKGEKEGWKIYNLLFL